MAVGQSTTQSNPSTSGADEEWSQTKVFFEWCLLRSVRSWSAWQVLLSGVVLAALLLIGVFVDSRPPSAIGISGRGLAMMLFFVSGFLIVAHGISFASTAVCWETSDELRDLVRLTGLSARSLLYCQSLARWLTIGEAMFLLLPLFCFARALGGVTLEQWIVSASGLVMLAALMIGFAMIATVPSGGSENAEATSGVAAFLICLAYHFFFWGILLVVFLVIQLIGGPESIGLSTRSAESLFFAISRFAPVVQASSMVAEPQWSSLLAPAFWCHFVTAYFCQWAATIVMTNRMKTSPNLGETDRNRSEESTTSRGSAASRGKAVEQSSLSHVEESSETRVMNATSSRVTGCPFFWKDSVILADGSVGRIVYGRTAKMICLLLMGLMCFDRFAPSVPYLALVLIGSVPILFGLRFDGLVSVEFKNQTWVSLVLLPVDLRTIIWSKVRVTAWELVPLAPAILLSLAIAAYSLPLVTVFVSLLAAVMTVLLAQGSMLTNAVMLSVEVRAGIVLWILCLLLNAALVIGGMIQDYAAPPALIANLCVVSVILHFVIERKLRRWSE